jgi:hypothetical protein
MKRSLEKWGRAPIILRGREHPSFWGLEHSLFRRARALTIQRTIKWRTSGQLQNEHERIKFMKCSLEKMRARTHYFWGLEHPSFWGLEHSFSRRAWALIIRRAIKWRMGEQMQNEHERNEFMKMLSWKNGCAHPLFLGARAPIILGARAPIFLEGHEHSPFREHSIREQMNEHMWI